MKYRASTNFALSLLAIGVATSLGGFALYRNYHPPTSMARTSVVSKSIRYAYRGDALALSRNPADQARFRSLLERSEAWHARELSQRPEFEVTLRNVPAAQNGFLRWVAFTERYPANARSIGMPDTLTGWLQGQRDWDQRAAESWLKENRPLLDEIRAMGMAPGRSVKDIAIERWAVHNDRLATACVQALMIEARAAVGDGEEESAITSVRAGFGLADQFDQIETPSLLHATSALLLREELRSRTLRQLMPSLPLGRCHPDAWQPLMDAKPESPQEYARVLRGEWHVTLRSVLLPTLVTLQDQGYAPDAKVMVAAYSDRMLAQIKRFEHADSILSSRPVGPLAPTSLSPECRELYRMFFMGSGTWHEGWERGQLAGSMHAAAFEILCGGGVPVEPISGKPFAWDARRRTLALPDEPELAWARLRPVKVPQLAVAR